MKRIYFDNSKKWIWLLIIATILIFTGFFDFIDFGNFKVNSKILSLGFLLQMVYFSRMVWYKNYVRWNKKGAFVRINSRFGKTWSFKDVNKFEFLKQELIITKSDGKEINLDLTNVKESDILKLKEILNKYST